MTESSKKPHSLKRLALLTLIVIGTTIAYVAFGESLTLASLAQKESELRQFQAAHAIWVYGLAYLLYVAVTAASIPGAVGLSLTYGWFFGWFKAAILVSFASTTGAILAFLVSRYLFREALHQKFGHHLITFNQALVRDGGWYLFTLRLVPLVPFFLINLVMGLTPLRLFTFWWISQVGMLPGTVVYVYAGSSFPDLLTLSQKGAGSILSPSLFLAFALIGILPWFTRWLMRRLRPHNL